MTSASHESDETLSKTADSLRAFREALLTLIDRLPPPAQAA